MVQGERKLIDQAEQLVVLVDSSKFAQRSSLIVCTLERVNTIITDDAVTDDVASMIEAAGVKLKDPVAVGVPVAGLGVKLELAGRFDACKVT